MSVSEFERITKEKAGAIRRGRPSVLTPEQKEQRREIQKIKNRLRNEARRRAHIVLQYRYEDEFNALMESEFRNLANNDERYRIPSAH
jgi:folylpolyglutamate synthase/dihydropteroate synthase